MVFSVFVLSALSGCLDGGTKDIIDVAPNLDLLPILQAVCASSDEPAVNASTGRIADVCNVAIGKGPRPVNEPSVAINPKDPKNIVAGANDYNLPTDVWCGVYVSKDAGATWTQGWLPGYPGGPVSTLTGFTACGDAALAFAPDGTLYYAGIAFRRAGVTQDTSLTKPGTASLSDAPSLFIARSRDGGTSWDQIAIPQRGGGPVVSSSNQVQPAAAYAALFQDKEFVTVGPDGAVYVSWTSFQLFTVVNAAPITLIKSTDMGATWSQPVTLSRTTGNQGSVPVVSADGTLTVAWGEFPDINTETSMKVVVRTSSDGGATFGDVVEVADVKPGEPRHGHRVNDFPTIAVDTSNVHPGRLYVAWTSNDTGDADVYAAASDDHGKTWTRAVQVNAEGTDLGRAQYFPWATVGPDGMLHIVYFTGEEDLQNDRLAVHVASSADGATFGVTSITDAPFLADRDGFTDTNFLGDYLAIAASELGVYPVWPDSRSAQNSLGDLDLYTARLSA